MRTPSTADVYVDGRLVSSVRLPPGQFTLNDLPIETGLGNARVIIRDAFGRQQSINLGFYLSTQLLKRGEQDYSYVGGLERTSNGTKVEYGRAMGTAVHSIGLADWLTIGFQAEGAKDLVMGGLGFHAKLWRLGTFGVEGLVSQVAAEGDRAMPRPASTPSSRTGSAPRCARRGSGRSSRTCFSRRPTRSRSAPTRRSAFRSAGLVRSPSAERWAVRRRSRHASRKSIRTSSDASPTR